jgi:hypothetical protein
MSDKKAVPVRVSARHRRRRNVAGLGPVLYPGYLYVIITEEVLILRKDIRTWLPSRMSKLYLVIAQNRSICVVGQSILSHSLSSLMKAYCSSGGCSHRAISLNLVGSLHLAIQVLDRSFAPCCDHIKYPARCMDLLTLISRASKPPVGNSDVSFDRSAEQIPQRILKIS